MFTALTQYTIMLLIGWASGISLYLTIALLGISGRMGWIDLPGGLEVLTHSLVIIVAFLMYAVEFVADKVPLVDSTWDFFHTFIRPVGAIVMAFMAGSEHGVLAQATLGILTGAVALDTHTVKASSRIAINTSPEPVSNVAASLAEDSLLVLMFWFYAKHPILATIALILFLVGTFFFLKMMWRFVIQLFERLKKKPPAPSTGV